MNQFNKLFALLFIFVSHICFSNESETSAPPCNKPTATIITSNPVLTGTGSNKSVSVCDGVGNLVTLTGSYIAGLGTINESYQYSWYKKGSSPVYVNNETIATKVLTSADAGTWILRVEDGNAGSTQCYTEDSVKFVVIQTPLAPTAVNPPDFCIGSIAPSWAAVGAANNTLQWYSTAIGGTSSATRSAINNSLAGTQYVWVSQKKSSAPGCESPRTELSVAVYPATEILSVFPNNTVLCEGAPLTIQAMATGIGTLSYQWKQETTNVGTNSNVLSISSVATSNAGSYTVEVTSTCGKVMSSFIAITVNAEPTVSIAGSGVYCPNQATELVAFPSGLASYTWTKDNSTTSIGSNALLQINSPGKYKVMVTGANGCKGIATKEIKELLLSARIRADPGTTVCEGETIELATEERADGYSWIRNGVLAGIGSSFTATEAGVYEVELTFGVIPGETCTATDKILLLYLQTAPECTTISGVNQINSNLISVNPNPSTGLFKVNLPASKGGSVKINIYNTLGELVNFRVVSQNADSSTSIDLQNSPSGVYLLEVETKDGISVKRIIKQ